MSTTKAKTLLSTQLSHTSRGKISFLHRPFSILPYERYGLNFTNESFKGTSEFFLFILSLCTTFFSMTAGGASASSRMYMTLPKPLGLLRLPIYFAAASAGIISYVGYKTKGNGSKFMRLPLAPFKKTLRN